MRKKLIAGNWKMNLLFDEGRKLFHALHNLKYDDKQVEVLIAPPALYLSPLSIANSGDIRIAAQNCHHMESGAYTGDWSAPMLNSIGVTHCILGHSERRAMSNETDQLVSQKVEACYAAGIVPILCCGESLEEREAGTQFDVVSRQIDAVLSKLDARQASTLVIAYEPVWAIGTGRTASSDQAQEMHAFIRKMIGLQFDNETADKVRILYGGSMKPANAAELLSMPDVDGGLIGGAALDFESFRDIIALA